ncbi:MAG: hypothetical protein R8K20_11955 [Gallionellaceae bacterium]
MTNHEDQTVDENKMKIIAHNVCREYYADKAAARKQEVRDVAEDVLGLSRTTHVEHHIIIAETQRSNRVTKDSVNKTATSIVITTLFQAIIMGGIVLAGVKLL